MLLSYPPKRDRDDTPRLKRRNEGWPSLDSYMNDGVMNVNTNRLSVIVLCVQTSARQGAGDPMHFVSPVIAPFKKLVVQISKSLDGHVIW